MKNAMNIARPDGSARSLTLEPVRILVIGKRDRIQHTIVGEASPAENHLCNLHFCDYAEWN
jgi:hypothetical protein